MPHYDFLVKRFEFLWLFLVTLSEVYVRFEYTFGGLFFVGIIPVAPYVIGIIMIVFFLFKDLKKCIYVFVYMSAVFVYTPACQKHRIHFRCL